MWVSESDWVVDEGGVAGRSLTEDMGRMLRTAPVGCGVAAFMVAASLAGCADLGTTPDKVPHSLVLEVADTLLTEGDRASLSVVVLDEDGNVIPGPPGWALPEWIVVPGGVMAVDPDGTLNVLGGGKVRVIARLAGLETEAGLRANPLELELSTAAVYLTQAAQNLDGTVPLIAGRDAFLRVFPVGDETSFFQPRARASFYLDGELVHSTPLSPMTEGIPTEPREDRLVFTHNARVPGSVIQPGLHMVVELDPDGVVPLAPGSQLRMPAEGTLPLNVVDMPVYHQTIVPTVQDSFPASQEVVPWFEGMTEDDVFFRFARTVLPIGEMEVTIHEPYRTSVNLRTEVGWNLWLREIETVWVMEGRRGYYYGASVLPPGTRWGGLGYLWTPVSVGRNSRQTYAHEVGHNMNLYHINCGSPGNPDANFPHDPETLGSWGFDVAAGAIIHPRQYRDLMSYCDPAWVSDYSFRRAVNRRLAVERAPSRDLWQALPVESTLMLWGGVLNGELDLEPAFVIEASPRLPAQGGPYRLEGLGPNGELRFGFDFTPNPVDHGGANFHFNVPYDPDTDGVLARVVLSGPEGETTLGPGSTSPMAIILNRDSGQVSAIVRGWQGRATAAGGDGPRILVSDGLPRTVR